jgi:hypothetical protein
MYATAAAHHAFRGRVAQAAPGADRNQALTYGSFPAMMRLDRLASDL